MFKMKDVKMLMGKAWAKVAVDERINAEKSIVEWIFPLPLH